MTTPPNPSPLLDAVGALGALVGTLQGFVVAWPTSWTDGWRRLIVGVLTGFIGSPVLCDYWSWPEDWHHRLATGGICALFSWTAIGTVMRILRTTDRLPGQGGGRERGD